MKDSQVTFEQVVNLAQQLPPFEKLRLIECLTSDIKTVLQASALPRHRGLRGVLRGCSIGAEDIDKARQEMWENFPREDL